MATVVQYTTAKQLEQPPAHPCRAAKFSQCALCGSAPLVGKNAKGEREGVGMSYLIHNTRQVVQRE